MVVLGQPHERRSRPRSRSLALTLRCSSVDGHVLGRRRRCRLVLPRDKGGTSVNRQSEAREDSARTARTEGCYSADVTRKACYKPDGLGALEARLGNVFNEHQVCNSNLIRSL